MFGNQVTEFKYITLIESVLTIQRRLDKALDVAGVRVDYEKLLPKQRKDVEAFISVFTRLAAGYRKSFCHGYHSTVYIVKYSPLTR